jgi:predicted transcriptional regulator
MTRPPKVGVGLSIEVQLRDRVDAVADTESRSRSWIICQAIEEYLTRVEQQGRAGDGKSA